MKSIELESITSGITQQGIFESAICSGVNQTDNLAMIHTLRQEITETKNELQDMNSETQKATKMDVKPTTPENSNKNVNFETTTKALEGLNTGMDVAIASASLLGVEHNRLTQIQAKLQEE